MKIRHIKDSRRGSILSMVPGKIYRWPADELYTSEEAASRLGLNPGYLTDNFRDKALSGLSLLVMFKGKKRRLWGNTKAVQRAMKELSR